LIGLATRYRVPNGTTTTCYDVHHRSRHYEQRCRRHNVGGRYDGRGDARRSASVRRTPKLSVGVDTRSHVILSAHARAGMCSDVPAFDGLLFDAWRRRGGRVRCVLADAGYDSERNHRLARRDMGVRSLIRAGVGRPSSKPPAGRYRRRMSWELAGPQKGKRFAERAQAETVMSMLKRNLGDALRARTPRNRRREHAFKAVVHDLMLSRPCFRGSRRSRTGPIETGAGQTRPRYRPLPGARVSTYRLPRIPGSSARIRLSVAASDGDRSRSARTRGRDRGESLSRPASPSSALRQRLGGEGEDAPGSPHRAEFPTRSPRPPAGAADDRGPRAKR
jgi:hypothetical protein